MYSEMITPRFGDVDGLGHINNTVMPLWFEQARNPIFRIFNPEFDLNHWNLIMARIEIDFLKQLFFNQDVEIKSWISHIGHSSFEVTQEAWQNGEVGARGKAVCVYFDFDNQKPANIPEKFRSQLMKHFRQNQNVQVN